MSHREDRQLTPDITLLLNNWRRGDSDAASRAIELVYSELKRMARLQLGSEPRDISLQPTDLVHELFIRMSGGKPKTFASRTHFFAIAAHTLRRVLADHGRRIRALKRGGRQMTVRIDDLQDVIPSCEKIHCTDLERALSELETLDPRSAKVVELRYFAGLTELEIAAFLGVSEKTIKRDWKWARAWLIDRLSGSIDK